MSKSRIKELRQAISVEIDAYLSKAKMTQRDFALKLGDKDESNLSKIMTGKRNLTLRKLVEIERAMNSRLLHIGKK